MILARYKTSPQRTASRQHRKQRCHNGHPRLVTAILVFGWRPLLLVAKKLLVAPGIARSKGIATRSKEATDSGFSLFRFMVSLQVALPGGKRPGSQAVAAAGAAAVKAQAAAAAGGKAAEKLRLEETGQVSVDGGHSKHIETKAKQRRSAKLKRLMKGEDSGFDGLSLELCK